MSELSPARLPPLSFTKKNGRCYARTYHNVWLPLKKDPTKKQAVKRDVKNVGVIESADGIGIVNFYKEFIEQNPELQLNDVVVSRVFKEDAKHPVLIIKPKNPLDNLRTLLPIELHKCGVHMVVKKLMDKDPLIDSLKFVFPKEWDACLSLAEFMVTEPDAKMADFARWKQGHDACLKGNLDASAISKLFAKLSGEKILQFFADYFKRLESGAFYNKERFWALDSTNFGCYGKNLSDIAWGKPKQDEDLPQLNVMMLVDQETQRPLFYKHFNGSIPDVSTIKYMSKNAIKLGARSFVLVFDQGYYGKDNLDEICNLGFHFVCCVPLSKTVQFNKEISEATPQLLSGACYDDFCGQSVVTVKKKYEVAPGQNREFYVHIFYDPEEAGSKSAFVLKNRIAVTQLIKKKKQLDGYNARFAKKFLVINDDGSVEYNNAAYQQETNMAGFFVIISDVVHSSRVAYKTYRARKTVEDVFSGLKAKMKMRRVRISTEETLDGKCFVQFLAISIWMKMEHIVDVRRDKGDDIPYNSLPHMIKELDAISYNRFNNNYNLYSVLTKKQRECLKLFGVPCPDSTYDADIPLPNRQLTAGKPHGWRGRT